MGFFDKLKAQFTKKEDSAKYLKGFSKTKESLATKLSRFAFGFKGIDEDFLDELMIALIESDIGVDVADELCQILSDKMKKVNNPSYQEVVDCLLETMNELYNDQDDGKIVYSEQGPTVILLVGVNGSGKTTTCAKLAKKYRDEGKKVAVVAADTFRAGAVDQLASWAQRLGLSCISGKENCDPSSVLVDGCRYAMENDIDILLCDTAGRLQNKTNLMNELSKMRRVVTKEIPGAPHNVWLVLDSTTGQNGMSQAKIFQEATQVTGLILTKMDGTAKGGIVIGIKKKLEIPVLFIGLGEKEDDLRPFDLEAYLYSIANGIQDDAR